MQCFSGCIDFQSIQLTLSRVLRIEGIPRMIGTPQILLNKQNSAIGYLGISRPLSVGELFFV